MINNKILCIIPARGGSKGIKHKNIKVLGDKPLIEYSILSARQILDDADICISTDDAEIIKIVESLGLKVPFIRPEYLATDSAKTQDVLIHALDYYKNIGRIYDIILLLQPTSPFRLKKHLIESLALFDGLCDMVVSVKETSSNPYYNIFEEDPSGYLKIAKGSGNYTRRQDAPAVWEYNGSIYVINTKSLKIYELSKFPKTKKYLMEDIYSIDIDTTLDWNIAEYFLKNKLV
jgi:CMP-N-acetylneuraminic acid synthetase